MIALKRNRAVLLAALSVIVTACGGGGSDAPTLSANQQAFESLLLAPGTGSYQFHWNLNSLGAQLNGVNYAYSDSATMTASPLTSGPQTFSQTVPRNVSATLALTPVAKLSPTRVLKNGAIVAVFDVLGSSRVSYVGSDVQVETFASDMATVAYTVTRSNFETVPLTGAISATAADFAHFHNSFFTNPAVLNGTATYAAGASYLKYTQTNKGDRFNVFDCTTATADANPTPCSTGKTLTAELTTGLTSSSDGVTYRLADGTVSTIGGVSVWVATAPRPLSATLSSTVQYRIYFELNGKVYTGAVIKDGAVMGGSYYISNQAAPTAVERLTFLPFQIRMNRAAHDSLVAAIKI